MEIMTDDLYLGAYALAKGCYLKGIKRNRELVLFEISGNQANTLEQEYLAGRANANVIELKA